MIAGEVEELRSQLESAERARKAAESELHEAADRYAKERRTINIKKCSFHLSACSFTSCRIHTEFSRPQGVRADDDALLTPDAEAQAGAGNPGHALRPRGPAQ